jgi:hypothetical protein
VILVKKSFMIIWAPPRGNLKLHILKLQFQITRGPGYPLYFAEPHRDASLLVPASIPGAEERCSPAGAGIILPSHELQRYGPAGAIAGSRNFLARKRHHICGRSYQFYISHQSCDTFSGKNRPIHISAPEGLHLCSLSHRQSFSHQWGDTLIRGKMPHPNGIYFIRKYYF